MKCIARRIRGFAQWDGKVGLIQKKKGLGVIVEVEESPTAYSLALRIECSAVIADLLTGSTLRGTYKRLCYLAERCRRNSRTHPVEVESSVPVEVQKEPAQGLFPRTRWRDFPTFCSRYVGARGTSLSSLRPHGETQPHGRS